MKVDGKEFIRNVGIEQDKERLVQEQQKLEELKRASVQREQNYMDMDMEANQEEPAFVDLSIGNDSPKNNTVQNNVEDILLDTTQSNNNKKKYIMLGFGLVLLFIITVLVIRLISNSDAENQLSTTNQEKTEVIKDDILNKIDSNEAYQKVIDRKNALEEKKSLESNEQENLNDIAIPGQEASNVPLVIDTPKPKAPPKRDLFGLDKEAQQNVQEPVKKVTKSEPKPKVIKQEPKVEVKPQRTIVVPPPKETNFTKKSSDLKGYFIQIGAFTRAPNKSLLRSITSKGYSYKIYKLMIKGRLYNKVLIGSYKTRSEATRSLSQVKSDFKNPNAYILKF